LCLYQAIAERKLAVDLEAIIREYDDLHGRVSATTSCTTALGQARFVLPKYEQRATGPEKKAAITLRRHLESLLERLPTGRHSRGAGSTSSPITARRFALSIEVGSVLQRSRPPPTLDGGSVRLTRPCSCPTMSSAIVAPARRQAHYANAVFVPVQQRRTNHE
jgi:hypothetical protein